MAAAVSNFGGIGSIGTAIKNVSENHHLIRKLKSLTKNPFNINVLCHKIAKRNPQQEQAFISLFTFDFEKFDAKPPKKLVTFIPSCYEWDELFDMLLEEVPPIMSFHMGMPKREYVEKLHKKGIFLWAAATSLKEAVAVKEAGLDAVVAQGFEAGGHREVHDPYVYDEYKGTLALVRTIVEAKLGIPVIAAGGIMDGAGIEAVLKLGKLCRIIPMRNQAFLPITTMENQIFRRKSCNDGNRVPSRSGIRCRPLLQTRSIPQKISLHHVKPGWMSRSSFHEPNGSQTSIFKRLSNPRISTFFIPTFPIINSCER